MVAWAAKGARERGWRRRGTSHWRSWGARGTRCASCLGAEHGVDEIRHRRLVRRLERILPPVARREHELHLRALRRRPDAHAGAGAAGHARGAGGGLGLVGAGGGAGARAEVGSYLHYKPAEKFDAIISICMMEHIVSPQEAREGKSVPAYRNYFRLAHEWTKPGSWFGLQTILRNFVPRDRQDVKDVGWVTYEIFPGGITPRLEVIIAAVNPYWEVMEVKTRRLD